MPFLLAPNLWSKLSFSKKDMNCIVSALEETILPELSSVIEEVFWMTFNESDEDTQEKFKTYVQLINQKYHKERYLSKNNQNIRRLELISAIFPHSKIFKSRKSSNNSIFTTFNY